MGPWYMKSQVLKDCLERKNKLVLLQYVKIILTRLLSQHDNVIKKYKFDLMIRTRQETLSQNVDTVVIKKVD